MVERESAEAAISNGGKERRRVKEMERKGERERKRQRQQESHTQEPKTRCDEVRVE